MDDLRNVIHSAAKVEIRTVVATAHVEPFRLAVDKPQIFLMPSRNDCVIQRDVLLDFSGLSVLPDDSEIRNTPDAVESRLVDAPLFEVSFDVARDQAVPRDAAEMTARNHGKEKIDLFAKGCESSLKPAAAHTKQTDVSIPVSHQLDQYPDLRHELSEVGDSPKEVRTDEILAAVGLSRRSGQMVRRRHETDVDATRHKAQTHLIFHSLVVTTPAGNEQHEDISPGVWMSEQLKRDDVVRRVS